MSREIKFRAWHEDLEVMVYSDKRNKSTYDIDYEFVINEKGSLVCNWNEDTEDVCGNFIEASGTLDNLMQYTGLKDKNGKEIYEGDILERKFKGLGYELGDRTLVSWGECRYVHIWKMEFERELKNNKDLGRWFLSRKIAELDLDAHIEDFEVIGNIYENPELLEGER